jgi:hypothetical protein
VSPRFVECPWCAGDGCREIVGDYQVPGSIAWPGGRCDGRGGIEIDDEPVTLADLDAIPDQTDYDHLEPVQAPPA